MRVYSSFISGGLSGLRGKILLQIGPGHDLGIALAFAGLGADVIALDKYPCDWRDDFHDPLYRLLAARLSAEVP
jgi:hypothetical protein